ncbi:MAG: tetratricopeptide repeat protein [Holophagales bacterium]|nr:tetratricopeptide repeat protein [Holophagales bacterium]
MSLDRPSVPQQLFYWFLLALLVAGVVLYGLWLHSPRTRVAETAVAAARDGSSMAVSGTDSLAAPESARDPGLAEARALIVGGPTIADLIRDPQKLELAKGLLDAVLEARPDSAAGHRLLGSWHLARGDSDSARRSFDRSLELDPGSLDTLLWIGSLEFRARNLDAAAARFRQAIELHPESVEAHNNLGQTLWSQGREGEAEQVYRRKLELAEERRARSTAAEPAENRAGGATEDEPRP